MKTIPENASINWKGKLHLIWVYKITSQCCNIGHKSTFLEQKDPRKTFTAIPEHTKHFITVNSETGTNFSVRKARNFSAKTRTPVKSDLVSQNGEKSLLSKLFKFRFFIHLTIGLSDEPQGRTCSRED